MCVTQQRYLNRDKKIQIFGKVPYIIVKKKKNLAVLSSCRIAWTSHNNERFPFTNFKSGQGMLEQVVYAEMQEENYGSGQEERKKGTREIHFAGQKWQQGS